MFKFATIATALSLALRASAFIVSTPDSMVTCTNVEFDIENGNPSDTYTAYIVNGSDPCGPEIDHIDNISGTSFTWMVTVPAGTPIMVALDNGSDEEWSGSVTVTGSDTSCFGGSSTTSTTSTTSSTTTFASVHTGSTYTAPANFESSAPSATVDSSTSGASRMAFGISSAFAVLGAVAVGLTL